MGPARFTRNPPERKSRPPRGDARTRERTGGNAAGLASYFRVEALTAPAFRLAMICRAYLARC